MPDEKRNTLKHNVFLEDRERISITGVRDVISFDEENILAETDTGLMAIKGADLHVTKLNLESGELMIDGQLTGIEYSDDTSFGKSKSSLFGKLFK